MNLGADDYLVKPVRVDDLLAAIEARLERAQPQTAFKADFRSPVPLEALGLSSREAEILLWVAQGKTNAEVGVLAAETLKLERTLSDLDNQAYGLTPAEIALMWRTAPPRRPIPPPAT